MLERKSIYVLYLFIFSAFTNLTVFTKEKYGILLLPILFGLAWGTLLLEVFTGKGYKIPNYRNMGTYVINFFILLFLTIGLINGDINKSFDDALYPLVTNLLIFHMILMYVQKREEIEGILLTIVLCGPLLALQGVSQFYQLMSAAVFDYGVRSSGWWIDPNTYAFVLDLIYLVSFYFVEKDQRMWRFAGYLAQLSAAVGVFLSLSRGGIFIFVLISLLCWRTFWQRKGYLAALFLAGFVVYLMVFVNVFNSELINNIDTGRILMSENQSVNDYSSGRIAAAVSGLMIFARHPFIGAGFGNILDYAAIFSHVRMYTHNMFVEILATGGLLPFLGYLFMLCFLYYSVTGKAALKTGPGKFLGKFILVLVGLGFFAHYLLYLKPVWVLLALFPMTGQLYGEKKCTF